MKRPARPRASSPYLLLLTLLALLPSLSVTPVRADIGGDFADLERAVLVQPGNLQVRRDLAEAYVSQGLLEEAVSQYLAILQRDPAGDSARRRITDLVAQRMPQWLPAEAADIAPFPHTVFDLTLPDPDTRRPVTHRILRTTASFSPPDPITDPVRRWRFSVVDYGYVWSPTTSRWIAKVRVARQQTTDSALADNALTALLSFYVVALDEARLDPTRPAGEPVDLWLTPEGQAGADSAGRSIYLKAISTPRTPSEWLREIAHEYGHISFPGIGGFSETPDSWADGDLGELLLIKWLAASSVTQEPSSSHDPARAPLLPWSVADAERVARSRRARLIANAAGKPNPKLLHGAGAKARDHFLGLALRVEQRAGPRFLAEALARCPRGKAPDFVNAATALAKERGISLWGAPLTPAALRANMPRATARPLSPQRR